MKRLLESNDEPQLNSAVFLQVNKDCLAIIFRLLSDFSGQDACTVRLISSRWSSDADVMLNWNVWKVIHGACDLFIKKAVPKALSRYFVCKSGRPPRARMHARVNLHIRTPYVISNYDILLLTPSVLHRYNYCYTIDLRCLESEGIITRPLYNCVRWKASDGNMIYRLTREEALMTIRNSYSKAQFARIERISLGRVYDC